MGIRNLQSVDGLISPDIAETLGNLPDLTQADKGLAKLARHYASLIDDAQPAAKYGEPLRYLHGLVDSDDDVGQRHLRKIEDALAAHSVASDLGPKLLACLVELGATPRSRKAATKGGVPGGGRLQGLRAARQ